MSTPPALDGYTRTDPGRVRENNEDAVGGFAPEDPAVLQERGALFVVADGMGGHAAGEVASNYAVNKILHAYYSLPWEGAEQTLAAAVQDANAEINAEGEQTPERRGMGSTVVAAAILDGRAVVANVGDSRAYLLHEDRLEPITRDHSWVAEHLADGMLTPEQAVDHPNRNILTRNLGLRSLVEPDVRSWEFADGDRLLLCTDGLWGFVPEEQLAVLLQQRNTAERATASLIAAANAAGGQDNIGVAVIGRGTAGRGNTHLFSNVPVPSFSAPITRQVPVQRTGLTRIAPYALATSVGVIFAAVIFAVAQAGGGGGIPSKRSDTVPTTSAALPATQSAPIPIDTTPSPRALLPTETVQPTSASRASTSVASLNSRPPNDPIYVSGVEVLNASAWGLASKYPVSSRSNKKTVELLVCFHRATQGALLRLEIRQEGDTGTVVGTGDNDATSSTGQPSCLAALAPRGLEPGDYDARILDNSGAPVVEERFQVPDNAQSTGTLLPGRYWSTDCGSPPTPRPGVLPYCNPQDRYPGEIANECKLDMVTISDGTVKQVSSNDYVKALLEANHLQAPDELDTGLIWLPANLTDQAKCGQIR